MQTSYLNVNKIAVYSGRKLSRELHYCESHSCVPRLDKYRIDKTLLRPAIETIFNLSPATGKDRLREDDKFTRHHANEPGIIKKYLQYYLHLTLCHLSAISHSSSLHYVETPSKNVSLRCTLRYICQRWSSCKARNPRDRYGTAVHVIGIKYLQSAVSIIHVARHVHKTRDVTYRLAVVTGRRCLGAQIPNTED